MERNGVVRAPLRGDRIIVPPATDMVTAGKRLSEYQGYDWWFVHKKYKR